jgi:hypothetical protein
MRVVLFRRRFHDRGRQLSERIVAGIKTNNAPRRRPVIGIAARTGELTLDQGRDQPGENER